MKKHPFYWLVLAFIVVTGCQKEISFDLNIPAKGNLRSSATGDCLPKTVNGTYVAASALTATNNMTISVNVITAGTFDITTNTVNGYFFKGTGTFTSSGIQAVNLKASGTPLAAGTDHFIVSFDGSTCAIPVDVLPAGAGGTAVYTLNGAPAACTGAVVNGTYATSTALVPTVNTATVNVMVTQLGSYSLTTTFQGMTFAKAGVFTTLGANSITLAGTGTPTTAGINNVPVTVGTTICNFPVTVGSPGVYSITCAGVTVQGNYQEGVALTATNTITIPITVTTAGAYSLTATVNGMTFSNSGALTLATTSIILNGTGTPATGASPTSNLSVGTPSCSVPITVAAGTGGGTIVWKFTEGGATLYQGEQLAAIMVSILPPFLNFSFSGLDASTNSVGIQLIDPSGAINVNETYSTVLSAGNSAVFSFSIDATSDVWSNDATRNLTFKVTQNDVTNKIIKGTFSGQVKNSAGTTKTISAGEFTGDYN